MLDGDLPRTEVHPGAQLTADFYGGEMVQSAKREYGKVSSEIINNVKGLNRVVYDISTKPPAMIEWERGRREAERFCTLNRRCIFAVSSCAATGASKTTKHELVQTIERRHLHHHQTAEYLLENGFVDLIVNRKDLLAMFSVQHGTKAAWE